MKDILSLTADDIDLSGFTAEDLCDISNTLNFGRWDSRLGDRPDWADDQDARLLFSLMVMRKIDAVVGRKAVLRDWNTRVIKSMTSDEFEVWYENNRNVLSAVSLEAYTKISTKLRKRIARKRIKALVKVAISGSAQRSPAP